MTKKGTHNYVNDSRNEHIKIYINGTIISRENARISVFDSGFLLGDGVWEGIRLHNGHLCFADEHFDRLINGAKQLKINIGKTKTELINIVKSVHISMLCMYKTIFGGAFSSSSIMIICKKN